MPTIQTNQPTNQTPNKVAVRSTIAQAKPQQGRLLVRPCKSNQLRINHLRIPQSKGHNLKIHP